MNGEVNGAEEPMDASIASPKEKPATGKTEAVETEAPATDCELSKTVDSKHRDTCSNGGQSDNSCNNGNGDAKIKPSSSKENGNKDSVSNHCSNSNYSCADSMISSQAQSESAVHEVDEKSKDTQDLDDLESGEEESESDEDSVLSAPCKATDTVSIDSGSDDSSQESRTKSQNSDIIILDAENRPGSLNGNSKDLSSPEIHEITSDNEDCVIMDLSTPPRRSKRAEKRKSNNAMVNGNDESDIEEVELIDPLHAKKKPSIDKKDKTGEKSDQDKLKESIGKIPKNLYNSMVARGLVVTPTASTEKITTSTQVSSVPPATSPQPVQPILPSLTDDMFVVEAPSFIVPYVYEKPSLKPFREFVDKLGKELEEIKAKEEAESLQKEKEAKEKQEQDRKARKERGEQVEDSPAEDQNESVEDERKNKKTEKKSRKKRREDDDASWDGEQSTDTEDETLTDDDTVVLKDKLDSIEDLNSVTALTADKITNAKSDNYFDCSLGSFFVDIGLNLVQEYVQTDLLKQQNRKLKREKKGGNSTKATLNSIASLTTNINFSKQTNASYVFPQKKCEFCSFKTESALALQNHLETPHMKNNFYKCNFCEFEIKSPHEILSHMDTQHNVRGRLEKAPYGHQCPNCPFEDNGKGKLARHQVSCAKKYKPENNLAPPLEWEPPAKIPKISRPRTYNPVPKLPMGALGRGALAGGYRARCRSPATLPTPGRGAPIAATPLMRGRMLMRHSSPSTTNLPNVYPTANNGKSKSMHQPSLSITPLPHQAQPVPPAHQAAMSTFVICEICDGYIKDLEQLRNHMQWIHKVKIHPKMIYNRPPLNCQKCQFRFFTDQGLERHLLGSHGLVTSSMQEAANKGKDAGRCPVCGRVYQWKLLNHVARDHDLTLKPAHLSYKCTVCTATFGMYKLFENHVYSAHSVVAKRVMDKTKTSAPAKASGNETLAKPIKIRDETTITPQSSKSQTSKK